MARAGQKIQNGKRGGGLARTRLADEAEGFAFFDG